MDIHGELVESASVGECATLHIEAKIKEAKRGIMVTSIDDPIMTVESMDVKMIVMSDHVMEGDIYDANIHALTTKMTITKIIFE